MVLYILLGQKFFKLCLAIIGTTKNQVVVLKQKDIFHTNVFFPYVYACESIKMILTWSWKLGSVALRYLGFIVTTYFDRREKVLSSSPFRCRL